MHAPAWLPALRGPAQPDVELLAVVVLSSCVSSADQNSSPRPSAVSRLQHVWAHCHKRTQSAVSHRPHLDTVQNLLGQTRHGGPRAAEVVDLQFCQICKTCKEHKLSVNCHQETSEEVPKYTGPAMAIGTNSP
jgi:hypothetical protein